MNIKTVSPILAALASSAIVQAAEINTSATSVAAIIARYAPNHTNNFTLETIPAVEGRDVYEIESLNGKIILRGNSPVAQASAFYHYLKEFCHANISRNGDNLTLPKILPVIPSEAPVTAPSGGFITSTAQVEALPAKIRVVSPVKHRLAYNYTVHAYTMTPWGKAEWAREIDILALQGFNQALIIQGQEAVWQKTFQQFKYSSEEMRKWICSPAHVAWQFMGNMEALLPPSQKIIDDRAELGKFIVDRCRSLGIQPVLQGYYGILPSGFAQKFPNAKIIPQGNWAGGNHRQDMLDPSDPLFAPIAKAFMDEQKKIYGGNILYYAADPLHEGGNAGGLDRGVVYKKIQDAILSFEPRATLVKQCWQTSNKEMFDAGNKDHSLALDLWCDRHPFWNKTNAFNGTPWVWCMLFNGGGNTALQFDIPRLIQDFREVLTNPNRGRMDGTASVPEAVGTNPYIHELMSEMSWRGAPTDAKTWTLNYAHARYGTQNPSAEAAWSLILKTAYSVKQEEGGFFSFLTRRPSTQVRPQGLKWKAPDFPGSYNPLDLAAAWGKLLAAAPAVGTKETYRYDLADLNRQVFVDLALPIFEKAVAAINAKDTKAIKLHGNRFVALLNDLDEITGTRRELLMGAWVADAKKLASTPEDKAYMAKSARMLLSTWVENPNTDLADYGNREWNGLVGTYYAPRWKMFFDAALADISAGKNFDQGTFNNKCAEFEAAWVASQKDDMISKPKGDAVTVSQKLFKKYIPILKEYHPFETSKNLTNP